MTFTELALLVWAIAASVVATHYWARHGAVRSMFNMAVHIQISMMDDTALYERMRAKYQRDMAAGVFGART